MELEELLELLDINSSKDLTYFEQFAELVEIEYEIPYNTILALFEHVDQDVLGELTEGYFEDILKYIPDDAMDLYALLQTIGQNLYALATAADQDGNREQYCEGFCQFRNWYTLESEVSCANNSDGSIVIMPVMNALALYRSEHLNEEDYTYDFTDALDYAIDEYIVPLASLAGEEDEYDDFEDEEL